MFTKKLLFMLLAMLLICSTLVPAKEYKLFSPDKKLEIRVNVDKIISYSLFRQNLQLILPSQISMAIDNNVILGVNAEVKDSKERTINETLNRLLDRNLKR